MKIKSNSLDNSNNTHSNIILIDYGIAFRIGNKIYLNKNLNKYPKLKKALINHELSHSNGLNLKDIMTDLNGEYLKDVKRDYYKFLFTEKKAWYQFLPLLKVENKWSWDLIMLSVWMLFFMVLGVVIKLSI